MHHCVEILRKHKFHDQYYAGFGPSHSMVVIQTNQHNPKVKQPTMNESMLFITQVRSTNSNKRANVTSTTSVISSGSIAMTASIGDRRSLNASQNDHKRKEANFSVEADDCMRRMKSILTVSQRVLGHRYRRDPADRRLLNAVSQQSS